ncbi:MAG: hypothetical protein ACJA0N_002593 [Pseudohongiellaceae bacterium]|jgi:hypothetical protein
MIGINGCFGRFFQQLLLTIKVLVLVLVLPIIACSHQPGLNYSTANIPAFTLVGGQLSPEQALALVEPIDILAIDNTIIAYFDPYIRPLR